MHVTLRLKLEDHEGLALFILGRLLKSTLLPVLPVILIQILICASLSPAPACCRGQSGTAWCCPELPVGRQCPAPNSGKLSVGLVYFALFLLLLIFLVVKLILCSICKSLSLFLHFPILWWEGRGDVAQLTAALLQMLTSCLKPLRRQGCPVKGQGR